MICTACGADKPADQFRRHADGSQMRYCAACHLAKRRAQHAAAKEHRNARRREIYAANIGGERDKAAARNAARYAKRGRDDLARWEAENPDAVRANTRAKMARYRSSLTESYVRRLLVQHGGPLKAKDIPQPLVELKRLQIQIERAVNEQRA